MQSKRRKSKITSKRRKSKITSKRRKSKITSKRRKSKAKSNRKKSMIKLRRKNSKNLYRKKSKTSGKQKSSTMSRCIPPELLRWITTSSSETIDVPQRDTTSALIDLRNVSFIDPMISYLNEKSYSLEELLVEYYSGLISSMQAQNLFKPLRINGVGNNPNIWNESNIKLLIAKIENNNIFRNLISISLIIDLEGHPDEVIAKIRVVQEILPYFSLKFLPKLQKLELINVGFKIRNYTVNTLLFEITSIHTLTHLQLNNNNITEIQPFFSDTNLPNLTFLDMSNNTIGNPGLENLVHNLPNLQELNVINCGITQLPANFQNLANLGNFQISQQEYNVLSEDDKEILEIFL